MSQFPPLKAPDGFELGVFSRMMLSQLPLATAPTSFETDVLQKATGGTTPPQVKPTIGRGINWKTSLASFALLATLVSVGWFSGVWDSNGLGQQSAATEQTEAPASTQESIQSQPVNPETTDIKKADQQTKKNVVKRGNRAVTNAKNGVAGH